MSKKKYVKKFTPLTHENLEIKNELLQVARNARSGEWKLENVLASVVIYSNIAEYLTENLLDNLSHFIRESTYKDFAGILYIESVRGEKTNITLGSYIKELEKFSFPDKVQILACIRRICEARNRIFHNFAKSGIEDIKKLVGEDLPVIQEECEALITKINVVYAGLQKILIPIQNTK